MIRLTLPARLACLGLVRGLVSGLGSYYADRPAAPSPQTIAAWALALHEAATNVVRHGHGGGSDAPLTLIIEPADTHVTFTLEDVGAPNPHWPYQVPAEPTFGDGGYGMRIIHQVMDAVDYQPGADGPNRLIMRAALPPPTA